MKIFLVSCLVLSTCSLTFASEYVDGISPEQPSKKDKRFIFQKNAIFQKLTQSLSAFSRISNSNSQNVPLPPPSKPAPTTARPPPSSTPNGSGVTLAIPGDIPTKSGKTYSDNDNLDYLTQYRDNAYAVPDTTHRTPSQSYDRLPPLQSSDNSYQSLSLPSPHDYSQSYSSQQLFTPVQQYASPDFNLGIQSSLSLPTLTSAVSQTYSQPVSYSSAPLTSYLPQSYQPHQQLVSVPQLPPITYQSHQQTHLSYVSPVQTTSLSYNQYQPGLNSAGGTHTQTTYYGNTQTSGSECSCKEGYKY